MNKKRKISIVISIFLIIAITLIINTYYDKKWNDLAYENIDLVKVENPTVVAFGDSITEGVHIDNENKWTTLLEEKLSVTVINSGIGGNSTKDGLKRIKNDVLDKNPNYVLINFGMNDHYFEKDNVPVVTLDKYEKNLIEMIGKIKNINALPILVLPHRIIEGNEGDGNMGEDSSYYYDRHPSKYYDDIGGANAQLKLYIDRAKEVANKCNIPIIDIYSMSESKDLYEILRTVENSGIDDGVHLSENGMQFYAQIISEDLYKIINTNN